MVLNKVCLADSGRIVNISITDSKIGQVSKYPITNESNVQLTFDDAIVFPGLINSHDHLDFNLFPALGDKYYSSYTEWGKYIHEKYSEEIESVLAIPIQLRERWGIYKNLLCGITTVVNHGEKLAIRDRLIQVLERCQNLHSVQFEKKWKVKLNNPLKSILPIVMHVGEGTDLAAQNEIDEFVRWNLIGRKLIGIHGVAMSAQQARSFKALIWCPESNFFLLNKTANIDQLKQHTKILFGSDSTLTGNWNFWEQIRLARKTKMLNDEELYHSLTKAAADIWQLNSGEIAANYDADLVVAKRKKEASGLNSFYATSPEDILLVMCKGSVLLFDETLYGQLNGVDCKEFTKVNIGINSKFVKGDLTGLMSKIKRCKPDVHFPISVSTVSAI